MADKPKSVCVTNRLPQSLTVSVDGGTGVREIPLAGHGTSEPVLESSLTEYTLRLAEQGRVRIRPVE